MKHIKEVYEYTDLLCNSLDDIAKVIKSTDNPGSHNQDFKEKIENIYNRFFEQVESRGLLSTAATIGKKTPKAILDYLHEGTGMRLAYGEQDVEKDIKDIDHRLSTLKEYQKEAKRVLDRLVQLKKDFQNVLSEKQDLLKSDELNEYCQQFEPLIEIMEGVHKLITDSSNSITSAINIEKIINRLAGM
jgi:prefoldin subunit 5